MIYNACDCEALGVATNAVLDLGQKSAAAKATLPEVIDVTSMKRVHPFGFKNNAWVIPELKIINGAAYWDYQRERVFLRTSPRILAALARTKLRTSKKIHPNRIIQCPRPQRCPRCASVRIEEHVKARKTIYSLKFTPTGIRRWVVRYDSHRYRCQHCDHTFNAQLTREWTRGHYGSALMAYAIYQNIDLRMPSIAVNRSINKLFGFQSAGGTVDRFREYGAEAYAETYDALLNKLKDGLLIHADETKVNVGGSDAFVWVFASMEEVAYVFAETREAAPMQALLKNFKGVLVSDFFAAYEALECPQQKCLIHLIRDLNDALHRHPFDEDIKRVARNFTFLLRPIVETVDRFGLKSRFLRKHRAPVAGFYKELLADELMRS